MDANVVALNRGYDQTFQAREQRLINTLAGYGELLVSFSGRLESCYSMDLCRASGVRFRAITLDNPTLSRQSVARARRYCRHYGIPHQVLKTDEMIFSVHLGHLDEVTDPVRYLCRQLEHDDGPPLLMSASVEEMREYLRRFHSLPANTLWLFAEQGMTQRDFRYGFHKRQLDLWGKGGEACLSRRFSDIESLDRRNLRMVDMAEQMLFDMGLDGAQVFFHTLADRVTTLARIQVPQRMRALVFDMQPSIQKALKSAQFDLVTLDMAAGEDPQSLVI
ncbi:hypothetical protein KAM329D_18630 [Aeromonas caviae]|uniref:Uncharacterized protein n=2 Tax=Aeromonas TaxID=642 RepID=A0AAV4YQ55_AERCA|nr:hypothetical protein KAM329_034050 [Aeromonas caviae]GJA33186.1 hypothetical protein KAM341_28640 [Aeromonas caviae]GJA36306.1 hypothetical protein KAM342_15490 [Aeromonas caviae]GJA42230.1 hypothetical protein KAM343_30260 [Aeromonas caviae]GJA49627.1 hypothetical protein KAM347_14180 [Aeromonas caviae]